VIEMNIQEILTYLPHRYPFLLVDKVLSLEVGKSLEALKNVSINEPFFMGHFPIKPVMPGVLIIEALAQAAAILAMGDEKIRPQSDELFYLGSVERARFKRIVEPGDQLKLHVEVLKRRGTVWRFRGIASVDHELVATVEMSCVKGKV
jgi:3-hydroxyacyl-[acyl-carrier-protein] dehydratase